MYFVEIDSKKVHSNLAMRYFANNFEADEIYHHKFTINQPLASMVYAIASVISEPMPIFLASAYIWNVEIYKQLFKLIKDIYPEAIVLIGGPEVVACDQEWLDNSPFDILIRGEGDSFFQELASVKADQRIAYLHKQKLVDCPNIKDLDQIGLGYKPEEIKDLHIAYYESSRGCPYNCAYCISSIDKGVRFKSLPQVKKELALLFEANIPIIKFIDRTFNAPVQRAIAIMEYIKSIDNGITTCHFELSPNLINEQLVETIASSRKDLFQFEIGIQSAQKQTLDAINRIDEMRNWSGVEALIALKNCHIHLDLIAGLPFETYADFKASFNAVMALEPDHLQVGMLKMLKGTALTKAADNYGYQYSKTPPYEFYANNFITIDEKIKLMELEEGTERIYNDQAFMLLLTYLNTKAIDMFEFYRHIGKAILSRKSQGIMLGKAAVVDLVLAEIKTYPLIDLELATNMIAADQLLAGIKPSGVIKNYSKTVDTNFSHKVFAFHQQFPPAKQTLNSKELSKNIKAIKLLYDFNKQQHLEGNNYLLVFKDISIRYLFNEEKGVVAFD